MSKKKSERTSELAGMSLDNLRIVGKVNKIKNYDSINKPELVEAIIEKEFSSRFSMPKVEFNGEDIKNFAKKFWQNPFQSQFIPNWLTVFGLILYTVAVVFYVPTLAFVAAVFFVIKVMYDLISREGWLNKTRNASLDLLTAIVIYFALGLGWIVFVVVLLAQLNDVITQIQTSEV